MRLGSLRLSVLSALRRFVAAQDGVVAVILALSLLPVMTLAGAAVDLRRISAARTNLQTTADAAALAGADALRRTTDLSKGEENAKAAATAFVTAAFAGASVQPTIDPKKLNESTVSVHLELNVPTTMMKLVQINDIRIKADAMAGYGVAPGESSTETAEIVLALDTTGSMSIATSAGGQTRLDVAKTAAKSLIEKVMKLPNGTPDPSVKVGLVPFAQYVNVGLQYRNESWIKNTQDISTPGGQSCGTSYQTWDRGPDKLVEKTCWNSDETSSRCDEYQPTWINPRDPVQVCSDFPPKTQKWNGCVGSDPYDYWDSNWGRPITYYFDEWAQAPSGKSFTTGTYGVLDAECPSPIIRLTNNQWDLNSAISAMTPSGFTYIAQPVLWGWRLLARGAPFDDAKPTGEAVKSLVLMTDGANTRVHRQGYYEHVSWNSGSQSVDWNSAAADAKTLAVCTNAKAAGIKIYTIGFMAPDSVKPLLKACATMPSYYYDAPSAPELQRAFNDIGARMTALRLIK